MHRKLTPCALLCALLLAGATFVGCSSPAPLPVVQAPAVPDPPAQIYPPYQQAQFPAPPEFPWAEAQPLADGYPADPTALVLINDLHGQYFTQALGAAIFLGNGDQVARYLAAGATLDGPIPLKLYDGSDGSDSSTSAYWSSPAHLAINAVFMREEVSPEFFAWILSQGADPNAWEVLPTSAQSVLHHTVTSGIPQLLEAVLKQGVRDIHQGALMPGGEASPLFAAVLRTNPHAVRILLEHGHDPLRGTIKQDGRQSQPAQLLNGPAARQVWRETGLVEIPEDEALQRQEEIRYLLTNPVTPLPES